MLRLYMREFLTDPGSVIESLCLSVCMLGVCPLPVKGEEETAEFGASTVVKQTNELGC